jgi:hypothetical protein
MNLFVFNSPRWLSQSPRNRQDEFYDYSYCDESPAPLS